MGKLTLLTASAGTGKTYRIVELLTERLTATKNAVRPEAVIGTTFTVAAANELGERIRSWLLESQHHELARQMHGALLGTVHSVCDKLIRRYAFEAGFSPDYQIMDAADAKIFFDQAITQVVANKVESLEEIGRRFGFDDGQAKYRRDWRNDIKTIVELARANGMDAKALAESQNLSQEHMAALLPNVSALTEDQWNAQLKSHLTDALAALRNSGLTFKYVETAVEWYDQELARLAYSSPPWRTWEDLSSTIGAKANHLVAGLNAFAAEYPTHALLHKDINTYIAEVFTLAAESMKQYENFKAVRGLADYTDLETMALQILGDAQVCEDLKGQIDLFIVDEFQDTSPIQLKLFLRLSALAKEAVWAGDPKQAIYGFRNTDPQLMQAVVDALANKQSQYDLKGKVEYLQDSYRTRKPLVEFFNEIFTQAFPNLEKKQIAIHSARFKEHPGQEEKLAPALRVWKLDGKNAELKAKALATGIKLLLSENLLVSSRNSDALRNIVPGDIAVVCRKNDECKQIAIQLAEQGIAAAFPKAGLLLTDEFALLAAAMRLFADQNDTLARAEIHLLGKPDTRPEDILLLRQEHLSQAKREKFNVTWLDHDPLIERINSARKQSPSLSIVEIMDFLIEELDLRRIIGAWGQSKQRLLNLEMLRQYSRDYEESCGNMHTASTVHGFLSWLKELAKNGEDHQGYRPDANAVIVTNYHKAKGLEWPVVIAASLMGEIKDSIWHCHIETPDSDVDLNDPLRRRFIRFLPWFLGARKNNPDWLSQSIAARGLDKSRHDQALDDDRRLLYVGFTRARDYLVLPLTGEPKWYNRIFPNGNPPSLQVNKDTLVVGKDKIKASERQFAASAPVETSNEDFFWFNARTTPKEYLPLVLIPSSATTTQQLTTNDSIIYAQRMPCKIKPGEEDIAGDVIHRFLAADSISYPATKREQIATRLIHAFEASGTFASSALTQRSGEWLNFLQRTYPNGRILREIPIRAYSGEQQIKGIIDLLVETADGVYLYDHKSFAGAQAEWANYARNKAPQLLLYKRALEQAGKSVKGMFIHFVVGGGVIELSE
jgi:ATP-dependent helicase/nuclease subunit A